MMLTPKERAWIAVLVKQATRDATYMRRWVNDPDSGFTRGIAERHLELASWCERLLTHHEHAVGLREDG